MHSIFKRFREPIFVIALLAVPFAIFFVKAKQGRDLNVLDRAVIFAIAPVEKVITLSAFAVIDAWHGYVALRNVREENVQLRRDNLKAHQLEQQAAELRLENDRLRHLLDYVDKQAPARLMLARVVAVGASARCDEAGQNALEDVLRREEFAFVRGKTNLGLGRASVAALPAEAVVNL